MNKLCKLEEKVMHNYAMHTGGTSSYMCNNKYPTVDRATTTGMKIRIN